ncbi:sugar ABC transporter ATP-binding protein [soil metagenome]
MDTAVEAGTVLEIDNVTKRFGRNTALTDVSMSMRAGEVRGVIGRNGAGKSTLVGIASGFLAPDEGTVLVNGGDAGKLNWQQYRSIVGMVHQHSRLVKSLSIAENLVLGARPPQRGMLINWNALYADAQRLLDEWDTGLRATQLVDELTLAQRQLVEIIRELARGVDLVILDEPTSRLEKGDIAELFSNVRRLSSSGTSVIYISHHLAEIHELCDQVTVLRDGRLVATRQVSQTTEQQLVHDMIGSAAEEARFARMNPLPVPAEAPVLLELDGIASATLEPLSLRIRAGECVGIAGLIGSGKEELGLILGGSGEATAGTVRVDGKVVGAGVRSALDAGIGFLPPDRHASGLVLSMAVQENITMTIWHRLANTLGLLRGPDLAQRAAELATDTGVATIGDQHQPVGMLSGGNQQKVALGRAIASEPQVLVLMNPTTGVDIASKRTIYELIQGQLGRGRAVLLISDEPDEFSFCNRIVALFRGRVITEFGDSFDDADLVTAIEGVGVVDDQH